VLSLVPIVPLLLYWLVPRLIGPHQFLIKNLTIPLNSFGLWWVLSVGASIVLLWLTSALAKRISRRRKKHSPRICFDAWLAVLAVLVTSCMLVAFRMVPALKMDSTMVSLLIGIPILGAAAIVAVYASKHRG